MVADKNKFVRLLRKGFWAISSIILFLINFEIAFSQSEINEEASDLIYRQDFSNETQDWTLDSNQGDWGTVNRSISDGTYQWEINLNKIKAIVVRPNIEINLPENDYQISLDTYFEPVCENCCSGILFNFLDMGNFYYAPLCTDGKIMVYAFENNQWILLTDVVQSDHFNPATLNKITVVNNEDNYEIQINDISLIDFTDNRFRTGTIGLMAEGLAETQTTVFFDNLEVRKKKPNEDEAPDIGVDSPYHHMNPVTLPLQDLYPSRNSSDWIDYMIDISVPFTFRKEGSGDLFCLRESDGKACLFIIRHFNEWNSPEEAADTIIDDYAKQVNNFEIYHQQSTYSAEGYPAYWVGAHFSAGENNYESSHLFIQAKNGVFQVFTYAPTDLIEQYRESLKKIAESFSYSK